MDEIDNIRPGVEALNAKILELKNRSLAPPGNVLGQFPNLLNKTLQQQLDITAQYQSGACMRLEVAGEKNQYLRTLMSNAEAEKEILQLYGQHQLLIEKIFIELRRLSPFLGIAMQSDENNDIAALSDTINSNLSELLEPVSFLEQFLGEKSSCEREIRPNISFLMRNCVADGCEPPVVSIDWDRDWLINEFGERLLKDWQFDTQIGFNPPEFKIFSTEIVGPNN